jgi:ATP-dependent Clp protease ATP-binding subunit ClpA
VGVSPASTAPGSQATTTVSANISSSGVSAGINLVLTDAAKDQLAQDGYDPVYGARPLKRLIQQQIENPLAKRSLRGDFAPGDTIVVDSDGETYSFAKEAAAVSP